jgi:hypothetical protein
MWKFKPSPERWSVHEIVIHLADSEVNSYARCRKFIAEPGSSVMAYDQNIWTSSLKYHQQNAQDALKLFRWLRHNTFQLIKSLPESVWSYTVQHPENGLMTMDNWLDVYERHTRGHIGQMKKNYDEWKKTFKKR